ncbi:MAG: type II toxin-antitoxin system Phd/YefM family antitoxin [Brachymonas sp.]|nr:type II toxin-antitoxin system Phd/YefM family antitoxin [Brachymonas sp.]
MLSIAANDLKTKGIAAIEACLSEQTEAVISVRGKERYVVMPMAQYHFLRECELDAALAQSRADIAAGRYKVQSAQEHFAEIQAELANEKN